MRMREWDPRLAGKNANGTYGFEIGDLTVCESDPNLVLPIIRPTGATGFCLYRVVCGHGDIQFFEAEEIE